MIQGLLNDGASPVLEAMVRFSGARQRLIAHNVANIDTPNFRQVDVSPREFQRALADAVERRRGHGNMGDLRIDGSDQIKQGSDGRMELEPGEIESNILFHDRSNRDLERLMQANAENLGVFRVATDLLRSRAEIMRSAMSERV